MKELEISKLKSIVHNLKNEKNSLLKLFKNRENKCICFTPNQKNFRNNICSFENKADEHLESKQDKEILKNSTKKIDTNNPIECFTPSYLRKNENEFFEDPHSYQDSIDFTEKNSISNSKGIINKKKVSKIDQKMNYLRLKTVTFLDSILKAHSIQELFKIILK